ncbi:MAG: hypothetical protein NTV63_03275 [Candidatus Woesearchaeota archaeon]|nr:hypothetical protein [Candidatus Woesearchaeota archaeon]
MIDLINIKNKFVFLTLILAMIFLLGCAQKETQISADENEMVNCGKTEDPSCFISRMNQCLPVTAKMTGSDGSNIDLTVLGIVNETCHFQRKINNVLNLDCYFPKGTMNMDTLDQTFGNDKGLQKVVDDACNTPGW